MKLGSEILWLSDSDVRSLLSMDQVMTAVESAFSLKSQGKTQMPEKIYLHFDPFGGDLRTMPAYVKSEPATSGVKIVNSNAKNPSRGLPSVSGIMTVVDPETGLPRALMAAATLTGLRTGAAGGIAARYLARPESDVVGLVGCGRQAITQLEALQNNFSLKTILVWGKTEEESQQFCKSAEKFFDYSFKVVSKAQQACESDIVVTTTPVTSPLIEASWIKPGTHINAIGADAPGKQELASELLKKAKIYVDEWGQASHAGEINVSVSKGDLQQKDIVGELGDVITGKAPKRNSDQEITIFDSTGLAIQDVVVAQLAFEKACKLNKGQVLKFNG